MSYQYSPNQYCNNKRNVSVAALVNRARRGGEDALEARSEFAGIPCVETRFLGSESGGVIGWYTDHFVDPHAKVRLEKTKKKEVHASNTQRRSRRSCFCELLKRRLSKQFGCDIHTHAPAKKGYMNIIMMPFFIRKMFYKPTWAWALV